MAMERHQNLKLNNQERQLLVFPWNSLAVCGVAPSCWNQKLCMSKSSSCGNKYFSIIYLVKKNIIEEINRITPDILEKVMENTVHSIRLCLNNNGENLNDIIFK